MFLFVCLVSCIVGCFFFKQKTAYEMRISDWSSDVCSSDLPTLHPALRLRRREDETTASYPKADSRPTQCPVPPSPSIFFDWPPINPGNHPSRRDRRLAFLPSRFWPLFPFTLSSLLPFWYLFFFSFLSLFSPFPFFNFFFF